jgi:hypothetical protein
MIGTRTRFLIQVQDVRYDKSIRSYVIRNCRVSQLSAIYSRIKKPQMNTDKRR